MRIRRRATESSPTNNNYHLTTGIPASDINESCKSPRSI
jgi:hypothetical protein